MTPDAVFVILVTYNRLPYLQQVLQALLFQTFQPKKIIVVNNGSTDGTAEWLSTQNAYTVINQQNSGGAGGFYTGVKAAFDEGAEWIWMMDDDVVPDPNCLEILLQHTSISSCLHPLHIQIDGTVQEEERWFNPADCSVTNYFNSSFKSGKKVWFRNTGSFEGMLISKEVVAKVGFPDKRFFLFHDDLIYGWLAHKHTNTSVIADAVMRKLPVHRSPSSAYTYLYYAFRNLWLLEEYAAGEVKGLNGYRKRRIRLQFIYEAYKIFRLKDYPDKSKAVRILFKAYNDYCRKKGGKTFL